MTVQDGRTPTNACCLRTPRRRSAPSSRRSTRAGPRLAPAHRRAPVSTGSVSVGVIIVEGPTSALKFSPEERVKVVAEVQNGLGWLGAQSSPTGVRFVYDIRVVTLQTRPGADDLTSAQKEALWRDPAMASLGYGAGLGGVQDYVDDLRSTNSTDWAYCAFFTKYPVGWFAYASIGGPRLVMDYANDGWGPDNIDRVFAHETGHIFGAPDEYASSGCNCGGSWGFFGKPNENCETCATGGGVPCLMRANTYAMCPWTPYHLGFPQGVRYSGAFTAGSGQYGLWVNADQAHFLDKWREWSGQGLRLRDLEVYRPGTTTLYGGVFEAGTGGYALWVNASWDSFRAKWEEWSGQGLRLTDIEVVRIGSSERYSGVFRAGSGGHGLWVNASWDSFRAKWEQWSGQGLRLTDVKVIDTPSGLRYSGVFAAGSGGYGLWVNASWDSFRAKWEQWSGQGLRLIDVNVVNVGGAVRYFGVFRAGTGRYGLWANADWPSFKAKWEEWSADGLRLIDVDVRSTGIEAAAAPTPADSEMAGLGFGGQPVTLAAAADDEPGFGARVEGGPIDEALAGFGAAVLDTTHGAVEPLGDGAGFAVIAPAGSDDGRAGLPDGEGGRVLDDPEAAPASPDAGADGDGGVQLDGIASWHRGHRVLGHGRRRPRRLIARSFCQLLAEAFVFRTSEPRVGGNSQAVGVHHSVATSRSRGGGCWASAVRSSSCRARGRHRRRAMRATASPSVSPIICSGRRQRCWWTLTPTWRSTAMASSTVGRSGWARPCNAIQ